MPGQHRTGYRDRWLDLGSRLGLLVPELKERMYDAMQKFEHGGLPDDLEHVTALALGRLHRWGELEDWMLKQWIELAQEYHETQCPECGAERSGDGT